MVTLEPRKYLTLEFLFELNNFYAGFYLCNIMYIIVYGAHAFLFVVDLAILLAQPQLPPPLCWLKK